MTNPDQPTVGDLTARLEFRYENDPLDFLKTGKGYLVVDDKVATIPLPTGEKGEKGDTGRLSEGDVRYIDRRTEEAEAAAEASETSAGRSKASETKAKTSETNAKSSETKAKTSETNAKSSETKAKTSETNAKSSETKAKTSEEESTAQAELSRDAAVLAITSAAALERHVADRDPTANDTAYKGAVWVAPDQVWIRGEESWHPISANDAEWFRPMLRSGDDLNTLFGSSASGIYPTTSQVQNLPEANNGGWVEVVYNPNTSSTKQHFRHSSWDDTEWTREHWNGSWREWRKVDATSVVKADTTIWRHRGNLETVDLDTLKTPGTWAQVYDYRATPERNYPVRDSGVLVVSPLSLNFAQIYFARSGAIYTRTTSSAGTVWGEWGSTATAAMLEDPPATAWETAGTLTTRDQGEVYLERLATQLSHVTKVTLGTSSQGHEVSAVIVGDSTKPAVMIEAGIHGDEVSGREAALLWVKRAARSRPAWMDHVCAVVVPTANPDNANLVRWNGAGQDINRSWASAGTPEVQALINAVDTYSPIFYVTLHETGLPNRDIGISANDYPWREGEPHYEVAAKVFADVWEALEPVAPGLFDYAHNHTEDDPNSTARAWLGEVRSIPALITEVGSLLGPSNWADDTPHENRFFVPMSERVLYHTTAIDQVMETMGEQVSGEPLPTTPDADLLGGPVPGHMHPATQVHGLDDVISLHIEGEKWVRPMLRSGDTLDDKHGADAVGVYPTTSAVAGLPHSTSGWVEVFYNPNTSSTTQRFFAASWAVSGEWEREHWAGSWREWRDTSMQTAIAGKADAVHEHTVAEITDLHHYSGTGSPEGKVAAPVGAIYVDRQATAGAVRWVKTQGTGNTGWQVEWGDTGWRDISATVSNYESGNLYLRRTQNIVYLYAHKLELAERTVWQSLGTILPSGFRPFRMIDSRVPLTYGSGGVNVRLQKYDWGAYYLDGHQEHSGGMYFQDNWATEQAWPSTLPGIPT